VAPSVRSLVVLTARWGVGRAIHEIRTVKRLYDIFILENSNIEFCIQLFSIVPIKCKNNRTFAPDAERK
jgi:hypothetical protein